MVKKEVLSESGYVKWFSELKNTDVSIAGGKGASLGEMYNSGFPVPPGFVITAQAYSHFISSARLDSAIQSIISTIAMEDTAALQEASRKIRALIEQAQLPEDLEQEILEAYDILDVSPDQKNPLESVSAKGRLFVAVRSSATTEDLADASFAGQQDSFLGVRGHPSLIEHVKKCFSSLFTARAIYYRVKKGFGGAKSQLAVVVQRMINSEKSGVTFSRNPLKNDSTVVIEAVWGLGEGIVSGMIIPDHYVASREEEVLSVSISDKKIELIRSPGGKTEERKLSAEQSHAQVLTGYEIKRLAQYAMQLESHYKKPQDIEFAVEAGQIYIVQSRPITTQAKESNQELHGTVLLSGLGASPGVGSGKVILVRTMADLSKVSAGDVLVTTMTNPDMVVSMQRAAAIVTDEGGITSHAAIVSREMGIPAVVGTREATKKLKEGQFITVDGSTGRVIDGKGVEKKVEIKPIVQTRTKVKVIVDLPDYAGRAALSGARGVGLIRLEGIIASRAKHPAWYLLHNSLNDYISLIARGLKMIAQHFDEMWVRTSDIRTDEYTNLEGAPQKHEGNPMLGNHGIRFSLQNPDLLEAEFSAIKEIADEYPDKSFGIMFPQIISVEEVQAAKRIAAKVRFPQNVVLGVMIETPAAVQIIEDLCKEGISFASFGTNDLTQYTLALDRNNEEIQELYSEFHPAVLRSIEQVIKVCREYGVTTSICGQAGSNPKMAAFLVERGIDSVSVNADAAHAVSLMIAELEQRISVPVVPQVPRTEHSEHQERKGHNRTMEALSEEELILKALDEAGKSDYLPGFGAQSEVPSLNDAIPVDSDQFN